MQITSGDEVMNIYEKLQAVRCELQALNLKKTGKNNFIKFSYYDLGDLLPSINILCQKHKITPIISFDPDYATLEIYDAEKSGETYDKIVFTSPFARAEVGQNKQALIASYAKAFNCTPLDLPESVIDYIVKNETMDIQSLGAAETYQRRYLYLTAFEIVEHDALDSGIGSNNQEQKTNGVAKPAAQRPAQNGVAKPAQTPTQIKWSIQERKAKIAELLATGADIELFVTQGCKRQSIDEVPDYMIQQGIDKKKNGIKK